MDVTIVHLNSDSADIFDFQIDEIDEEEVRSAIQRIWGIDTYAKNAKFNRITSDLSTVGILRSDESVYFVTKAAN